MPKPHPFVILGVLAPALALSLLLPSCSRKERDEPVAVVNGSAISLKDLKNEVSLAEKKDPSFTPTSENVNELLHEMIERKLIVQQAVKKGLSEDEKLLESLKSHWEQTLIRQLLQEKAKEWSNALTITEEEVRAYYSKMGTRLTLRTIEAKDEPAALSAKERLSSGDLSGSGIAGPLMIEEMEADSPLLYAFDLPEGGVESYRTRKGFIIVMVVKKERLPSPAFEQAEDDIKASLLEYKKRRATEEWIEGVLKDAKIEINEKGIRGLADEVSGISEKKGLHK